MIPVIQQQHPVILIESEYNLITPKPQLTFKKWFPDFLTRLEKFSALYISENTRENIEDPSKLHLDMQITVGLLETEQFEEKFKTFIKNLHEDPDALSNKTYDNILKSIAKITPCSELEVTYQNDEIIPLYYIEQFFNDADLFYLKASQRPHFLYKFHNT